MHHPPADLLAAAEGCRAFDAAGIAALRRNWSAEMVKAAIDLVTARRKAAEKFTRPADMLADPVGVEQATSEDVARHKAARFAPGNERIAHVVDLCCGIGGDAIALATVVDTSVIDLDPRKVEMARHNVALYGGRCSAAVADVTTLRLAGRSFHIDPARRSPNRRLHRYEDYQPGPGFLQWLIEHGGPGALKLGPGIDLDQLPQGAGEVEFISRRGTLVQAVLWTKQLARAARSATVIGASGIAVTLSGSPRPPSFSEPRRYLLEVDASVERAGLMGNLASQLNIPGAVHPALGLLTVDQPRDSPFVASFELIEQMPWREKKVKQWLAAHDGGIVEVKTRGKAVEPDAVARRLRGEGDTAYTLFVLRMGQRVVAWITRRQSQ